MRIDPPQYLCGIRVTTVPARRVALIAEAVPKVGTFAFVGGEAVPKVGTFAFVDVAVEPRTTNAQTRHVAVPHVAIAFNIVQHLHSETRVK